MWPALFRYENQTKTSQEKKVSDYFLSNIDAKILNFSNYNSRICKREYIMIEWVLSKEWKVGLTFEN